MVCLIVAVPCPSRTSSVGPLMDPFERLLTSLVEHMMQAWQLEPDRAHPLGELAAEAAAVLQFYREREPRPSPKVSGRGDTFTLHPDQHWSHEWKRYRE